MKSYILVILTAILCVNCLRSTNQNTSSNKLDVKNNFVITDTNYVPRDINDCHQVLNNLLTNRLLEEIKQVPLEKNMVIYHESLGRTLRNSWGLWNNSRLAIYFQKLGVNHPDHMSSIILQTFWCHLNNKPFNLENKIKRYHEYEVSTLRPQLNNCSLCPEGIDYKGYLINELSDTIQIVHFGNCKKDSHLWVYTRENGWYKPDIEIKRKITLQQGVVLFDDSQVDERK